MAINADSSAKLERHQGIAFDEDGRSGGQKREEAPRNPQGRGGGLSPAWVPRRERGCHCARVADDEGEPLLLLPKQGRDPLFLPRLLGEPAAGPFGTNRG